MFNNITVFLIKKGSSFGLLALWKHSPDLFLSAHVLLDSDGSLSHVQEPASLPPAPHVLLDGHARRTKMIQTQLLQVRHLSRPEEDLTPTELVLVGILECTREDFLSEHG